MKTKRSILLSSAVALLLTVPISTTKAGDVYWDDGGSYLINDETYKSDWVRLDYNIANDPGTHLDLVDGGKVGMLSAYHNASITMTGGSSDYIHTYGASSINVSGGKADMRAHNDSTINITGGDLGSIEAWDNGIVNYLNHDFYCSLSSRDYGVINIHAGLVSGLSALDNSTINLHKCDIEGRISGRINSSINVYALDLEKFENGGFYDYGYMSGHWLDGTEFQVDFAHPDTYEHVYLVPEPSILSLFTIGFIYLSRKKR